ncbi:hypothetical protein [Paenibacillus chungangensis]|uniref:DUF2680 domain-containing protein n=1 Tax=Paenibacillus chungangensis TaxID=696535 RepID=A0ABW3HTU7_9BACL
MTGKRSIVTLATAFALAAMLSYSSPAAHAEQSEVPAAPAVEQDAAQKRNESAGHGAKQQPNGSAGQGKQTQQNGGSGEQQPKSGLTRAEFEAYRLQKLREAAAYFGIETEGKNAEQLKKELQAAKEANKEKWEAFKAENRAKHEEYLRKMAESQGIETEGKTAEQLKQELMERHGVKDIRKFMNK